VTEREGGPAAGPAKATAWTALVTTAFMSLVVTGAVGISQGIFAVYWVRDLGASRGSIMAAGVSASIIGGFMAVPMGRLLAGRLHAHVLLAFGAVCGAVSCLLFALATEVWQIVLTLAVTVALALAAKPKVPITSGTMPTAAASIVNSAPGSGTEVTEPPPSVSTRLSKF